MPNVRVGPDVKNPTHDISLSNDVETWGIKLEDGPRGIQEIPQTPSTLIVGGGGKRFGDFDPTFTHLEQRTWEGGRGVLYQGDDPTRFWDSKSLWTVVPNRMFPAPVARLSDFGDGDLSPPVDWDLLEIPPLWIPANSERIAWPFTAANTYTASRIGLWMSNDASIVVTVYDDSSGEPGTAQATATFTANSDQPFEQNPVYAEFDLSSTVAISSGTQYWISVTYPTGWEGVPLGSGVVAIDPTGTSALSYSDVVSPSWDAISKYGQTLGGQVYFNLLAARTSRTIRLFELDGGLYAIDEQDDGTASLLYMNGERGKATGGTASTLVDTDNGIDGSWVDDQWNGARIKITDGTGKGQTRSISDTSASGNSVTVSNDWDITPSTDSEYVIYDIDSWQDITPSSGDLIDGVVKDVAVYNDIAVFALGQSIVRLKMRFNPGASPPAHEFDDDSVGSSDLLHTFYHPTDGVQIWECDTDAGTVRRSNEKAWATDLDFGSAIDVGDSAHAITNLFDYDGKLFVAKTDSIWYLNGDTPTRLNVNLEAMPHSTNGTAAAVQDVFLYFNWSHSIERYYSGTLDDIGPWKGEGMPSGRQGYISDIKPLFGWLVCAVDGGRSNTSSVLLYNGQGYHEIYRSKESGSRIRSIYIHGTEDSYVYIYVSDGNDLWYIKMPAYSLNPIQDTSLNYTTGAELISGIIDFDTSGLVKYISEIDIFSENLNSETYIRIDYQFDEHIGTTTWFSADSVYVSPIDSVKINVGQVQRFRYRLRFVVRDADNPPVVLATVVKGFARSPVKYQYNLRMVMSSIQRTRSGALDHDPNEIFDFLKEASSGSKPIWVRANWDQLDSKYFIVEPGTYLRNFSLPQQSWEGGTVLLTLREV